MADKNYAAVDKEKLKAAWREFVPDAEMNETVLNKTFNEVCPIFELISRIRKKRIKQGKTADDDEGKVDLVMKNKMAIVQDHVIAFCQKYLVAVMDIDSITQGKTESSIKISLGDKWDEKLNSLMAFYIIIGKDKLDEDTLKKGMTEAEIKEYSMEILQELVSIRENPHELLSQVKELEEGNSSARFVQFNDVKISKRDLVAEEVQRLRTNAAKYVGKYKREAEQNIQNVEAKMKMNWVLENKKKKKKKKNSLNHQANSVLLTKHNFGNWLPPTEKYLMAWKGRHYKLHTYLSYSSAADSSAYVKREDKHFMNTSLDKIFKGTEDFLLQDSRYALLKDSLKLSIEERAKQPNYRVLKGQFDNEVVVLTQDRVSKLVKRIENAYEETFEVNSTTKAFFIAILLYMEDRLKDLLPYTSPLPAKKPSPEIVDKMVNKLGKETISEEEVNLFSDFFTSLPVRNGVAQRKEIAVKILKDGKYSDTYKEGLLVQDRFGNTLFSMALSSIPETERKKFKIAVDLLPKPNESIAAKVGAMRATFRADLLQLKQKKQTYWVDSPILQFLKDPSREILRQQLKYDGNLPLTIARYPKDPAQQTEYYKQLFTNLEGHPLHLMIREIISEHIDFSNTNWLPMLQLYTKENNLLPYSCPRLGLLVFTKLRDLVISPTLFVRIHEKVNAMMPRMSEQEFQSSAFGVQIKSLFKISFAGFQTMLDVLQCKELKGWLDGTREFPTLPDGKKEHIDYEEFNTYYFYRSTIDFVKSQMLRQVLFYQVVFQDHDTIRRLTDHPAFRFSLELFSEEEAKENFTRCLKVNSQYYYVDSLVKLLDEKVSNEQVHFYIARHLAFKTGFKAFFPLNKHYLDLIELGYKTYTETNLAELALSSMHADPERHLMKQFLNVSLYNPRPGINLLLKLLLKLKEYQEIDVHQFLKEMLQAILTVEQHTVVPIPDFSRFFHGDTKREITFDGKGERYRRQKKIKLTRVRREALDPEGPKKIMGNYSSALSNAYEDRMRPNMICGALTFCRHALEVLAVYFHEEQADLHLVRAFLDVLLETIGSRAVLKIVLQFVASKYPRGSSHLQAFCVYLINQFLREFLESGVVQEDRLGCVKPPGLSQIQNKPKLWTSLVYNRFINTAITKEWCDSYEKESCRLLDPIVNVTDPKSLTQVQLFNIILMANHTDFSQIVYSSAFDEDEKLKLLGLEIFARDEAIKAEVLKLMKIPGMTRHCLHYVLWLEKVDAMNNAYSLKETLQTLTKLNDFDFNKMATRLWQTYSEDAHDIGLKLVILAGLTSRSLAKLCTVLRLSQGRFVQALDLEQPVIWEILQLEGGGEWTGSTIEAIYALWPDLGRLMATSMLCKYLNDSRLTNIEGPIQTANLPNLLISGQKYFGHVFLGFKAQVEAVISSNQKQVSPLYADLDKLLANFLEQFCTHYAESSLLSVQILSGNFFFAHKRNIDKKEDEWLDAQTDNSLVSLFENEEAKNKASVSFIASLIERRERDFFSIETEEEKKDILRTSYNMEYCAAEAIKFLRREYMSQLKMKRTEIETIADIFNYNSVAQKPRINFGEECMEMTVIAYMGSFSPSVLQVKQLAKLIVDPQKFARLLGAQAAKIDALKIAPAAKGSGGDGDDYEDDEEGDSKRIDKMTLVSLINLGMVFACFAQKAEVASTLISALKTPSRTILERIAREFYLKDQEFAKNQSELNKDAYQKIKAFVQSGATATEDLLRPETPGEPPKRHQPKVLNKKREECKDYYDLIEIASSKETALASNPSLISEHSFLIGNWASPVTFSAALIKQIFSDQKFAMTKLMKACSAWQRASENIGKICPVSQYRTNIDNPETVFEVKAPVDAFSQPEKTSAEKVQVMICSKDEVPPSLNDDLYWYYLPVAFDVVEQKSEKQSEASSYLVKVNYEVFYFIQGKKFHFDPKARQHPSQYDLYSLTANLKSELEEVETKLGTSMLSQFKDSKLGALSASIINIPTEKRLFFHSNFGENLVGYPNHNERFVKKQKAFKAVNGVLKQLATTGNSNAPRSVADQVNAQVGVGNLKGKAIQTASYLSAWDSSINSL